MIEVCGQKDEKGAKADGGDVNQSADVPTEFFGDLLEYGKGRVFRTDEEHIDRSAGGFAEDQIDGKGNSREHQEHGGCGKKILFCFCKAVGGDQVSADEDQEHVPDEGVQRQRPIFVYDARGLDKRHDPAKQIKGCHKMKHAALYFPGSDQGSDDAQIHGNTAELKGKDPPLIVSVSDMIVIEKLFIDLRNNEERTYAEKDRAVAALADVA